VSEKRPSEWAYAIAIESPVFKEAASRSAISDAEYESFMRDFADVLDAARAQGRREGLEEAAKVAEKHADHADAVGDMRLDVCASTITAEIRALIDKEPTA